MFDTWTNRLISQLVEKDNAGSASFPDLLHISDGYNLYYFWLQRDRIVVKLMFSALRRV